MDDKFEMLKALLASDRSTRRFDENRAIDRAILERIVGLVGLCASGRNAQPLRYRLVVDNKERTQLFPLLKWAGYYSDWDGPVEGERPAAYIVQCLDTDFGADCLADDGIELQAMTLGATTLGMRCCIIKAFNAQEAADVLSIPQRYKPRYVVAIGFPNETVRLEKMDGSDNADFKYYRTPDGVHHVPKRPLCERIIG